jgi:hypothetical protein
MDDCSVCHEPTRDCELACYHRWCENCVVSLWIHLGIIRQPNGKDGAEQDLGCNPNRLSPALLRRLKARRWARNQ